MKFTWPSGSTPLEGFTIKRGIGRGGFGEVYFAISDGGKEVALKLLRDNSEIELRGVAQCLNLKHPGLINLYDLRIDGRGDHWVVMEYIAGESLQQVISRHPGGLPLELVKEWFLGIARAVGYLHDHGIVHRDLKPANVFLENGVVKVGDYGLSKSITGSQRTAQTQSIGTVHYMAPEISTGNYNKQIDVYATGVMLYEMLSGKVPFDGESAGEILMKHLTAPPDLSILPSDWATVVGKALAKNPVQRYQNLSELARAVEEVGNPSLARPTPVEPKPAPVPRPVELATTGSDSHPVLDLSKPSPAGLIGELCGSLALTTVFAAVATALWGALAQRYTLADLGTVFLLTTAVCWAVLIPTKFWSPIEDSWGRRVVMLLFGLLVGAHALWLDGWQPQGVPFSQGDTVQGTVLVSSQDLKQVTAYLGYFGVVFFALRWWKMTERQRPQRFTLLPVLATGFWALSLLLLWPQPRHLAVALVLASAIVQVVSPWQEPPPPVARRLRLRYS